MYHLVQYPKLYSTKTVSVVKISGKIRKYIKLTRYRWAGDMIRKEDQEISKKLLLAQPLGSRQRGRRRLRWRDVWNRELVDAGTRS